MAKTSKQSNKAVSATDAIALLTNDHQEVKDLFEKYDELAQSDAEDDEKQNLAEQICTMLPSRTIERISLPRCTRAVDTIRS